MKASKRQLPENIKVGDIIRIKSVSADRNKQKNMLETVEASNIMLINPSFKQYQMFYEKLDHTEYDLTPAILGEVKQQ